ncbi:MAG: DUF4846 domain-containing protein [Bacteroidota bacterium]
MKNLLIILAFISSVFVFCKTEKSSNPVFLHRGEQTVQTDTGKTIKNRFSVPAGYERIKFPENSFGNYLQTLPLKESGSAVMLFNGNKKFNQWAHAAVIDIDVGKRDLQQCADAVMRLRAEYLFQHKKYDEIMFHFVNGFNAEYKTWHSGHRISVSGNKVKWVASGSESSSYKSFRKYLNMVFAYAGTLSLAKELNAVPVSKMEIGDVFIQGGSPGHAVIVVDMAENKNTGEKIFMLAQSYMPAQDIHILKNPNNKKLSPWYKLNFGDELNTPEWDFSTNDLKSF